MNIYYLHLGSNQGDRKSYLNKALELISTQIGNITKQSSVYETEPWGLKDQPLFLNMAVEVKSEKSPEAVLPFLKNIELSLGVEHKEKWGPRNIDIDILYCNHDVLDTVHLKIPHPHIYDRNFVLIPLMEIAGDYEDPVKKVTIDELYDLCKDESEVFMYE
ncbi:MAG: 2-amino-4-hydroxy-6-hydroxymethyldihydropteridine diphosphokinase, partial [Saprospiraceae bacterium]|nr:2-amino-4-hydroxy-6-hydroxymethyldihydropteridine diphosphokinase [Saprospiraceae bacterium]